MIFKGTLTTLLIVVLAGFAQSTNPVSVGELQALEDLYTTCNGASWFNHSNWMTGDPCINNWYGVGCSNSHVVKLLLNSNGLSCSTLPATIGNLFMLAAIDFSDNEINAPIPSAIQNLRTLQHLDWSHNEMSGILTAELGSLLQFSLTYLDLSFNDFTGQIPNYFNGAAFTFIDLSSNNFICPIPSWAAYTQATCINWTVSYVQSKCIYPGRKWIVYGDNFAQASGVECSLSLYGDQISSVPAQVISETELLCPTLPEQFHFNNYTCNANLLASGQSSVWHRPYEAFNLTLTIQNQDILPNHLIVSVINPYCSPNTFPLTLQICESANPTPFLCPSSYPPSSIPYIKFAPDCVNNNTYSCFSYGGSKPEQVRCPTWVCSNNCNSGTCTQGCCSTSYTSTCYSSQNICQQKSQCS